MTSLFNKGKNVFTIPAGVPFMPALLAGLEAAGNELHIGLEDMTVFLPTRRAIRTFQQHIINRNRGRPVLLPALRPLGGLDEEDLSLAGLVHLKEDLSLPPAIDPVKRLFLLQNALKDLPELANLGPMSTQQRLLLAGELTNLLDQMQNEGAGLKDLSSLEMERELADHWNVILQFLGQILKKWPEILAQKGLMDPVQRRADLIGILIKTWQKCPPKGPVFAAGSTGSVPVVRGLLKAIAELPKGAVIFPGFDREMDNLAWEAIEENHPQFMMNRTLKAFDLPRDKVRDWPFCGKPGGGASQLRPLFARDAMLPAAVTGRWHEKKIDAKTIKAVVRGLDIIECPGPRVEAGVIALILRHALEEENKTAALITPDRELARRVKAELKRWEIEVDDSAGTPLLLTPPGTFFSLALEMIAGQFAPVKLLALLKHPLAHAGLSGKNLQKITRALDRRPLRGTKPAHGIKGLVGAVKAEKDLPDKEVLTRFLQDLGKNCRQLSTLLHGKKAAFSEFLEVHIRTAHGLSCDETGKATLWEGENGRELSDFLTGLIGQADALGKIAGEEYPAIIDTLLQEKVVKPHLQTHPRLAVLGTLEARLQNFDLVVLGGMNEGSWPREPAADPWMNRDMRKAIGLPTPDQRVGQSAHDLYMALGVDQVILTRSGKSGGSPTTPSRWLQRMTALLGNIDLKRESATWLSWYQTLDMADKSLEIGPPQPKPELSLRPRRLSVTNIELLMRDPYAVYAKHILGLRPLDDLEADPSAADKGNIVHEIFDDFLRRNPSPPGKDALERLLEIGYRKFDRLALTRPMVKVFWWPRFKLAAEAFIAEQMRRASTHQTLATEVSGAWQVTGAARPFEVTAKADRIDRLVEDGTAVIIDYKTGLTYKKNEEITSGRKPQLALEGVMAGEGAFKGLEALSASRLEYWKIGASAKPLEVKFPKIDISTTIDEARSGIVALVNYFDDQSIPYLATPDPEFPSFGEYDLLARTAEWQNRLKNSSKEGGS